MALKNGIFTLALGALLVGTVAQADDTQTQQNFASDSDVQAQGLHGGYGQPYHWDDDDHRDRGYRREHVHSSRCNHGPQPTPPHNQQGRYELKLVQKWVPGYYQQVWVPQDCRYKPRRHVTKCTGGYYEQQWVPGRYETVEQWVWVPMEWRRDRGSHRGSPANYWH
jgi:hypothetical protein